LTLGYFALAIWLGMAAFLLATVLVTIWRCRGETSVEGDLPPCSVVLPVKGASPFLGEHLTTLARLKALRGDILVCVARQSDPAIEIVAPIVHAHSDRMRLLVGEATEFSNPKLRNLAKGYRACQNDTVLFLDDSVMLEPTVLRELLIRLRPGIAITTAVPVGTDARSFPAEVEAATCNGYLVRLEMFLGLFGKAAAFGNALAFRKEALERVGGLARMAEGPCEDNALSKALLSAGDRLVLAHACVRRRIGHRSWKEIWNRHVRWKNCARAHDPMAFAAEFLIGGLMFNVLGTYALSTVWGGVPTALALSMCVCYGLEAVLNLACGWPFRPVSPIAWITRDLMHPAFGVAAIFSRRISWRGEAFDLTAQS
jgi:ceramide glucosyltransferase